eukprot:c14289_g1_i1.p1 GENE.c14289_g1_i1~~c14289_g1_i1.p1  ORF type:complete len:307 (+),score=118.80 c14289_g1_i1:44-964(+)
MPFIVMIFLGLPDMNFSNLRQSKPFDEIEWGDLLNTVFWSLNYFDASSTLAAEVQNPGKTYPRALIIVLIAAISMYAGALIVGNGVTPENEEWDESYFARIGEIVGGEWLKNWIVSSVLVSSVGMFESELSTNAYLILGMTKRGMLPAIFAHKSKFNTPTFAILVTCSALSICMFMSLSDLVEMLNLLYIWGAVLEFAAFIYLRITRPDAPRPYRLPLGTKGVCLLFVLPFSTIAAIMYFSSWKGHLIVVGCVIIGTILVKFLRYLRSNQIIRFLPIVPWDRPLPDDDDNGEEQKPDLTQALIPTQ